ncbi:MAG: HEAT repeat domain-containing protein [Candidatus Hodarchaeota archaeon]
MSRTSGNKKPTKKKTTSKTSSSKSKKSTKTKSEKKSKKSSKKKSTAKKTPKTTERKKAVTKPKKTSERKFSPIIDELALEIQSEDEQIAMGAIERLGSLQDKQATGILVEALNDSRYMVRILVAAQLGERKDKTSIGALIIALNDESIFVRQTVAGALENIGGKKAKEAVKKAEAEGLLLNELPEGRRL